jgi:hypothetical protein
MTLKLLFFSGFGEVNVSQFASQFVSRILVDGAPTGAPGDRLNARLLVVGEDGHRTFCFGQRPQHLGLIRQLELPKPRKHSTIQGDHEYKRLGTVTLSAPSSGIENFSTSLGSSVAES